MSTPALSPAAIIRAAKTAGIVLDLNGDRIRATGPEEAIERLRPMLEKHKSSIVGFLSKCPRAPSALVGDRGGVAEGEERPSFEQPSSTDSSLYAWISAVSAAAPVAEFGPAIVVLHRPGRKGAPGRPYKAVTLADYVAACERAAKVAEELAAKLAAEPTETGDEKAKGRSRR